MPGSRISRWASLTQAGLALIFFCLTPLYGTTFMSLQLYGLIHSLEFFQKLSLVEWVFISPLLYVSWLNAFLVLCAIDIQAWRLLFKFKKPRRASTADGFWGSLQLQLTYLTYLRERVVTSLPLVSAYLSIPWLQHLVFWSYSPTVQIAPGVKVLGSVYDPDLTEIGEGSIIGARSAINAHSFTTNPDGSIVLVTAPVVLGPRVVLGGGAMILAGVRVGADSLIEPLSCVASFTIIGEGEIWGGNPAQFRRKRFESSDTNVTESNSIACGPETPSTSSANNAVASLNRDSSPTATIPPAAKSDTRPKSSDCDEEALRRVISTALNLPLDEVHSDLTADQCDGWDSLGQLGIAAALHDHFGISLSADESFKLKSMADLRQVISQRRHEASLPLKSVSYSHAVPSNIATLPDDPELLPLLDHELITRLLAERDSNPSLLGCASQVEPVTVVIASTFVAEPVATSLKLWCRAFEIPVEFRFAGFNQIQQCLRSPDSKFATNSTGINIVLTRPEDFESREGVSLTEAANCLLEAVAEFAGRVPGTLAVCTLPPVVSTFCTLDAAEVGALRAEWSSRLAQIGGIATLDFGGLIEHIGVASAGRTDLEVVARTPYSASVYQELGIAIARLVRQQRVAPAKVIAVDADGVLWGGVLGEEGLSGIHLGSDHPGRSHQLLQRHLKSLKERGCLLVLVSRNAEQDVWRVFDEHPEMVLRREDITAVRINWQPKSGNLRELAAELNLGLDSFVFIDDDPANRAEVAANAPGVTVVPLSADPAGYCGILSRLWRFDATSVTKEDRERSAMMRAERKREQGREGNADLASYLQSLQLRVEMRPATAAELPRVAQLTQKTNQFNLSLKRRSLPEIQALEKTHSIHVIHASDKFGDYGLIGAAILGPDAARPNDQILDTLLISCRALGRGIEDAILHGLCGTVSESGTGSHLIAPFVTGPRNQPCLEFLERIESARRLSDTFEFDASRGHALPMHIDWHQTNGSARKVA